MSDRASKIGRVYRHNKWIEIETITPAFSLDRFKSKRDTPAASKGPKPVLKKRKQYKTFAIVPLDDGWGYQAITAAGRGAAIVLYVLYKHRTGVHEVPITAAVLKQCGVTRKMRALTIKRLVKSGFAMVRYHGNKFHGCPLLTLLSPE